MTAMLGRWNVGKMNTQVGARPKCAAVLQSEVSHCTQNVPNSQEW